MDTLEKEVRKLCDDTQVGEIVDVKVEVPTSRKHYWTQTGKLLAIQVALVFVEIIGLAAVGIAIESSEGQVADFLVGMLLIVLTVHMYAGYGFWKGFGGYVCARLGFFAVFALIGILAAIILQ